MKSLVVFFTVLNSLAGWAQGTIHLNQGESYTYQFSTVPFQSFGTLSEPFGLGTFYFPAVNGDTQNVVLLETFETNTGELPLRSLTLDGWSTSVLLSQFNAWQDLQGAMRITVLSGQAELSGFKVEVIGGPLGPFNYHSAIVSVPEPSVLALLGVGSLSLFCLRKRGKR